MKSDRKKIKDNTRQNEKLLSTILSAFVVFVYLFIFIKLILL
jgi:hypothetical protein